MIALLLGVLLAAPGSAVKQGGLPPMLLDPDSYTSEQSDGLPSGLGSVLDQVIALPGASFGVGVVDFVSGERLTRRGTTRFQMDTPDIVAAAYSVARHNSGEFPLDTLVARDKQLWMMLHNGQQGSREQLVAAIYHCGGFEPLQSWLSSNYPNTEFNGVTRDWAGAPESAPNYTSVNDCLDFMEFIYSSLDTRVVRRMSTEPFLSSDIDAAIENDNIVYGWISGRGETRCINLIISRPDGAKYGVCVLANDLCCPGKADLAFTTIWRNL